MTSAPGITRRWLTAWPIWVPAIIAIVAYARAATLGLSWDDAPLTVENPNLGSLGGLWNLWSQETWKASGLDEQASYYRPLAMTSFWLTARISNSPLAHHVTSVIIQAANASLLGAILLKRVSAPAKIAFLGASLWALLAASSEVVLWISGRFDALATTCLLAAFLLNGGARPWRAVIAFAGALVTKEIAIAWVVVLLLDDRFVLRRDLATCRARWGALVGLVAAYFVLRAALGISTAAPLGAAISWFFPALGAIIATVLAKLVVPIDLDPLHPLPHLRLAGAIAIVVTNVGLIVLAARKAHREREGNTAWSFLLIGLVWFFVTLLPMAIIYPGEPVAGQRYGYAASVGLFLIVGASANLIRPSAVRVFEVALSVFAVVQGALVERRIPAWQDRQSIAASMVLAHPDNAHAYYYLGYLALERGDEAAADDNLARSLAITRSWRALDAACVLDLRRNRLQIAELECFESANLQPINARVWVNLASVHVREKRWNEALQDARRALAIKPQYVEARYLGGVSAANLGLFDEAKEDVHVGLGIQPSHKRLLDLSRQLERAEGPQ